MKKCTDRDLNLRRLSQVTNITLIELPGIQAKRGFYSCFVNLSTELETIPIPVTSLPISLIELKINEVYLHIHCLTPL